MSSAITGSSANKFGGLPSFNCCQCQSGIKDYKECMKCDYHSQANMPHTRKVLKIHKNVKPSQESNCFKKSAQESNYFKFGSCIDTLIILP